MTRNWKWILMMAAVMLAVWLPCVCFAEADPYALQPLKEGTDYTWTAPDGLKYTHDVSADGQFKINIDVENSLWGDILSRSSSMIAVKFQIRHPEGAAYFAMSNGNAIPNDSIVLDEWADGENVIRNGWATMDQHWMFEAVEDSTSKSFYGRIADYVEEFSCVTLTDAYEKEDCYIRWYAEDGTVIKSGKLTYRRDCSKLGAHLINEWKIFPKNRVVADMDGVLKWSYDTDTFVYDHGQNGTAWVGVEAPEGAVYCAFGFDPDSLDDLREKDGKLYAVSGWGMSDEGTYRSASISVYFKDADGEVIERGKVKLAQAHDSKLDVSSEYRGENFQWEQVPDKNLIIYNGAEKAGYQMKYHKGLLTTKVTGNGHDLLDADASDIRIEIIAPTVNGVQAKSCRINTSGSSGFYGPRDEWFYEGLVENAAGMDATPVVNGKVLFGTETAFTTFYIPQNNLNIYLPVNYMENEYYVDINMILWYASADPGEEEEPICIQYYNRRDEQFRITHIAPVLSSEKDIVKGQKHPIAIDRKGRHWNLYIRYYLQSGDNARYYELKCQDENGQWVELPRGEELEIYLPYPEGYDQNSPAVYTLNHYSNDVYGAANGSTIVPLEADMPLQATEYGLMFKATSFSPYVLSWEETTLPEDVQFGSIAVPLDQLTEVPGQLGEMEELDTIAEIAQRMTEEIVAAAPGFAAENVKVFDVVPHYSVDGENWLELTPENWPVNENGKPEQLLAFVPYPEQTGRVGFQFTLAHMYTIEMNGHRPGEVNFPAIDALDEWGIWFYTDSLSPVAVAWKAEDSSATAAEQPPKTGDNAAVELWFALAIMAVLSLGLIAKKKTV